MRKKSAISMILAFTMCTGLLSSCASTPAAPTIESISLGYNTRNTYTIGDTLSEEYNRLCITYSDGTTEWISADDGEVSISGDTSQAGTHTATLTYKGQSLTYDYTVYQELSGTKKVSGGEISGYVTLENDVEIYKGIPYAAPPTGDNRWRAPKDVIPWDGVKKCVHFGPSAVQGQMKSSDYIIDNSAGQSEDCLNLNVWTSMTEETDKPVLVYIHGGGFTTGGASCPIYDGTNLARKGLVVVSINYRLGMFGFMATEELKAENDGAGNFAILDMIKALEWVRDNIAEFGGDKDNVTIMGQSAGAVGINALLACTGTEGLFKHAMAVSGNSIGRSYATIDERVARADLKGKTISELRAMSTEEVTSFLSSVGTDPCIDGDLFTDSVKEAYMLGRSVEIDFMTGNVQGDLSDYDDDSWEAAAIEQQTLNAIARQEGGAEGNTWVYCFDYAMSGAKKCMHTDDVPMWFGNSTYYYGSWTEDDARMADIASSYLVNFCRTGNPNGDGLPEWVPSTGDYSYQKINLSSESRQLSEDAIAEFEASEMYLDFIS